MADFNPGNSKLRIAPEAIPGVLPLPADAKWIDAVFNKAQLGNKRALIASNAIRGGGQAAESLPGKFETGGSLDVEANAEGHAYLFANAQERVTTTSPDTGVYVHKLFPSGDDPVAQTIALLISRDDAFPQNFRGGAVKQVKWSWKSGGLLEVSFQLIFPRGDYWGSATVTTDPSATPPPQIRGLLSYANYNADDSDIYVKVTAITNIGATPPSVTVVAKRSAAATYGAVTTEVPIGVDAEGEERWTLLLDSNGTNGATFGVGPSAPALTFPSATGLAINDAWRFNRARALWTPAFPAVSPFPEIYATILLNGLEICVEGFDLTVDLPVEAPSCLGNAFAHNVRRRGQRKVTLSIDREYIDVAHRWRLETGEPFGFEVKAKTGTQFVAGYEHELHLTMARIIPEGDQADVDDANKMSEKISGQAFPSDDVDFPDDLVVTITNSIADIATGA
jgi:hypothetical protein